MKELFRSEDKDGSGGLNKAEVTGALQKLGWWHRYWHHRYWRRGYWHHYLAQESGAKKDGAEQEVSAEEAAEQALARMDVNGDGEVQPEEMASLVEDSGAQSRARMEELFRSEDKDGSGGLNKAEVTGALQKLGWWHRYWHHRYWRRGYWHHYLAQESGAQEEGVAQEMSAEEAAEQALARMDANGDGEVQPEEMASLVEDSGAQSRARVEELFRSEDKDGSGG